MMNTPSSLYHNQSLQTRIKLMLLYSYYHRLEDFLTILVNNETSFFKIQLQKREGIYDPIFTMREYFLPLKAVIKHK